MTLRTLLYTYRRCPYAMRARMALLEAGVEFDAYEISLKQKPPEMLALSPKGTVPVLVLPGGKVIDESLDIMRWALEAHGALGSWARSQTSDNLALISLNDGAFKQHLDRYKYPEKFPDADRNVHRAEATQGLLQSLGQHLSAQPYLGGMRPCAADLAIFPFVRQFRAVDLGWFDAQALPATQLWLHQWLVSKLFVDCMKKLPVGLRVVF